MRELCIATCARVMPEDVGVGAGVTEAVGVGVGVTEAVEVGVGATGVGVTVVLVGVGSVGVGVGDCAGVGAIGSEAPAEELLCVSSTGTYGGCLVT